MARVTDSRLREAVVHSSLALVRLHLAHCVQRWALPQRHRGTRASSVRATLLARQLEHEGGGEWELFSLEKTRGRGHRQEDGARQEDKRQWT